MVKQIKAPSSQHSGCTIDKLGLEIFPGQPCNCWPHGNFRECFRAGPGSTLKTYCTFLFPFSNNSEIYCHFAISLFHHFTISCFKHAQVHVSLYSEIWLHKGFWHGSQHNVHIVQQLLQYVWCVVKLKAPSQY